MDPDATVTDGGTVRAVLLLVNVTAVAAVAAALSVTVQVLDDAPESEVGLHATELRVGTEAPTDTVPPLPEEVSAVPVGSAVTVFETVSCDVAPAVTATVATTPLAIAVEFIPDATHVYAPVPCVHCSVLPAAVRAGPAVAAIALIPADGY